MTHQVARREKRDQQSSTMLRPKNYFSLNSFLFLAFSTTITTDGLRVEVGKANPSRQRAADVKIENARGHRLPHLLLSYSKHDTENASWLFASAPLLPLVLFGFIIKNKCTNEKGCRAVMLR